MLLLNIIFLVSEAVDRALFTDCDSAEDSGSVLHSVYSMECGCCPGERKFAQPIQFLFYPREMNFFKLAPFFQ